MVLKIVLNINIFEGIVLKLEISVLWEHYLYMCYIYNITYINKTTVAIRNKLWSDSPFWLNLLLCSKHSSTNCYFTQKFGKETKPANTKCWTTHSPDLLRWIKTTTTSPIWIGLKNKLSIIQTNAQYPSDWGHTYTPQSSKPHFYCLSTWTSVFVFHVCHAENDIELC